MDPGAGITVEGGLGLLQVRDDRELPRLLDEPGRRLHLGGHAAGREVPLAFEGAESPAVTRRSGVSRAVPKCRLT